MVHLTKHWRFWSDRVACRRSLQPFTSAVGGNAYPDSAVGAPRSDMQDLVGQCFSLGDERYRIVDVRYVGGESMVYAEELRKVNGPQPHLPRRAAFHYTDIVKYLALDRPA